MAERARVAGTRTAWATRPVRVGRTVHSRKLLGPLAALMLAAIVYRVWLEPGVVTAGDWPYVSRAGLADMAPFPSLWNTALSTGVYNILAGPMFPLQALQGAMSLAHLDWAASERLVWLY